MKQVAIFGSINIDEVYGVPHIVLPGETISSTSRQVVAGGKGANCCLATGKAGAKCSFYANIGPDAIWIKQLISEARVDVSNIRLLESGETGRAVIQVDQNGENSIFLFPGVNFQHNHQHVLQNMKANSLSHYDYLVLQNEINNVAEFITVAKKSIGSIIVWNPAPMPTNPDQSFFNALKDVDILIVNEPELISLSKLLADKANNPSLDSKISNMLEENNIDALPHYLQLEFQIPLIVVTRGSNGVSAFVSTINSTSSEAVEGTQNSTEIINVGISPIKQSQVVDTTAAGDTWIGYFVSELSKSEIHTFLSSPKSYLENSRLPVKQIIERAMNKACHASGICVTRRGAIPSIPDNSEVDEFLEKGFWV
ncbi:hypothetical protein BB560_003688 [Smittium megazygosporum]|uniref:Ribokinase n=1 Tax=Smittium megazygosporum TaxID=133381 RepID=A0A2T9ZBE6_9FUNG|nr:hypothetical protein BB560_003688 [Smittium megazygosporum]